MPLFTTLVDVTSPATFAVPPLRTAVTLAVPPARTSSVLPLLTTTPELTMPEETNCVLPAATVPVTVSVSGASAPA